MPDPISSSSSTTNPIDFTDDESLMCHSPPMQSSSSTASSSAASSSAASSSAASSSTSNPPVPDAATPAQSPGTEQLIAGQPGTGPSPDELREMRESCFFAAGAATLACASAALVPQSPQGKVVSVAGCALGLARVATDCTPLLEVE